MVKLAHTRIVTRDVRRLSDFYERLTGAHPSGNERYLELDGAHIALAVSDEETVRQHGLAVAAAGSNQSVILDFEVDDVDGERARISAFVTDMVMEPTNQPWGNRSMIFKDPDGNLINMFSRLRDVKASRT
jgi:predicted enzyme related to lactoylglutathione lyase